MNTTIITTNSINKFNQLLNFLYSKKTSILPSPATLSITLFTNSSSQTNSILSGLTKLLNLKPIQPSYALVA